MSHSGDEVGCAGGILGVGSLVMLALLRFYPWTHAIEGWFWFLVYATPIVATAGAVVSGIAVLAKCRWAWIPGMASVASLVLYFWVRRSL